MKRLRAQQNPIDLDQVEEAVSCLKRGGIVAMRTDTVYGLLASVNRPDALRRLVDLKVRPVGKPFVVVAADWIGVRSVTAHLPPVARFLGSKYWPGPLTLVLPAAADLPDEVTAVGPTVAVRIPSDPLLLRISQEMKAALAAPSANLPEETPARGADEIEAVFGNKIDLLLDGGDIDGGRPSTIVTCAGSVAHVIREGSLMPPDRELTTR